VRHHQLDESARHFAGTTLADLSTMQFEQNWLAARLKQANS